ncbi:hypothetical protein SAMN05216490_0262 [Mucilaginibacter mallensis]|uniref:Nucleotide-diphospho-sugar transferase n=1 Tax=Mucilaginibacter mallensis TaxID=652787 RepID=A0A1H1N842_MUCMA|nr:nucleotide-diphospho-sugar transferase [Mucilaginibacter mallensis]SDR95166.1 hypothetical protein SAMN05216490_0262 [Mucilaginibacter mallensis]
MINFDVTSYKTKSAVLFVIFNRPDTTLKVFEQIKLAQPPRLYIAADAPRADVPEDKLLCEQARAIIDMIDWACDVKTLFNKQNAGCKKGVSSAVTWFFNNEEEGIILEDDCLPANSFFKFCDTLLDKYRDDYRIRHITGCNLQHGKKWGNNSYYFSNMTFVWGWASWKRVWDDYKKLDNYNYEEVKEQLGNIFGEPLLVDSWLNIFEEVKAGKLNSWGYQLDFVNFFNNGLTIVPNDNLISNIGFGPAATHTLQANSLNANVPVTEITEITHPVFVLPEKQADMCILNRDFNIEERKRRQNLLRRKVKRWFKQALRTAATYMFIS